MTTRVAPRGMESFAHAFPLPTAMLDPVVGANSTRVVIIVGGVLRVDSARSAARPSPTELSPALHASQPAPLLKEISVKSPHKVPPFSSDDGFTSWRAQHDARVKLSDPSGRGRSSRHVPPLRRPMTARFFAARPRTPRIPRFREISFCVASQRNNSPRGFPAGRAPPTLRAPPRISAARGDVEGSMDDSNEPRAPSEPREVSVQPPSRHTLSSYRYATVHVSGERVARTSPSVKRFFETHIR